MGNIGVGKAGESGEYRGRWGRGHGFRTHSNSPTPPISASLSQPHTVLFAFAGPQTESRGAMEAYLDELATYLKAKPSQKAVVKGYTDDKAARENNLT